MTSDEIEDCFPDGGIYETDDGAGITTSVQWLHEFAKNVAAVEREACAKVCDPSSHPSDWTEYAMAKAKCAAEIRKRSG